MVISGPYRTIYFLLASIAKDLPRVYWVQVTREIEAHVNSTLYMLQTWCSDRCKCDEAPRCVKGNTALIDRLYFDRFDALGHLCKTATVPRDLVRDWLRLHERETSSHMRDHPRFLRLSLEDGPRTNAEKMVHFLGVDESALDSLDYESLHQNKRAG